VNRWFKKNWSDRVRQFGLPSAVMQLFRALVRPLWMVNREVILAISNHKPGTDPADSTLLTLTVEMVENWAERGALAEDQKERLLRFLDSGCHGIAADVDGAMAGYGFVQPDGIYEFGRSGKLQIPENMMLLKNLLVLPAFRGRSLGKFLNQARISSIPEGHIPIVFVMQENRFAIRNLKMFGFEEELIVIRTVWFKRWTTQNVRVLNNGDLTSRLIDGLEKHTAKHTGVHS